MTLHKGVWDLFFRNGQRRLAPMGAGAFLLLYGFDQEDFMKEVERIRKLGAKHITLKTGAYPMRELAMAIRWSSDAEMTC